MIVEQTLEKLHAMKLRTMARAFEEQLSDASFSELCFEERLGLIVDREYLERQNRRLARRLSTARFRFQARIEELD